MSRIVEDPTTSKDKRKAVARVARQRVKSEIEDAVTVSIVKDFPQIGLDLALQGASIFLLPVNLGRAVDLRFFKNTPGTLTRRERVTASAEQRTFKPNAAAFLKEKAQAAAKKRTIHTWESVAGAVTGLVFGVKDALLSPNDMSFVSRFAEANLLQHLPATLAAFYLQHNPGLINTAIGTSAYLLSQAGRYAVQSEKVRNLSLRYYNASRGKNVRPR